MSTAVINVKVEPGLKTEAQKVAAKLGFSLSSLVNGYLRQLVMSKRVEFCLTEERPSEYLINALKQSEEERIRRKIRSFKNREEVFDYLDRMINARRKN